MKKLDNKGVRIQYSFDQDAKAFLSVVDKIRKLIPSGSRAGSSHPATEGEYIETLVRSFLRKHLPSNLAVYTGFILRGAVKVGKHNRTRRTQENDSHSRQLDVIVYDRGRYPVYEQYDEFAIVPPEGVIGVVSVKRKLYAKDIENELEYLHQVATLCKGLQNNTDLPTRGPNLAIFSPELSSRLRDDTWMKSVWKKYSEYYKKQRRENLFFDDIVGQIIVLMKGIIYKDRPSDQDCTEARILGFPNDEPTLDMQYLLTGILSVYYDESRSSTLRPGFTSFRRAETASKLGSVDVGRLR